MDNIYKKMEEIDLSEIGLTAEMIVDIRMTREEAIQFLDNMKHEEAGRAIGKDGFYAELMGYHVEALNMAIKALEQEPCEDAISRQAVLEMSYDMSEIDGEHFTEPCMVVDVDDIQKLPSVNPQPKTGHWIKIKPYPLQMHDYECSECLHETDDNTENYCSECGARMVEPQERSDKE